MFPGSVVPETVEVTEAEFRAAMLAGLSRCANQPAAKRNLAAEMDLSSKGLDNILLKGATPGPKRLWDATRACPAALDEIAALYGFQLVAKAQPARDSHGTLPIATLLHKVAEAESPASDGGTAKTHQELLAMEANIRAVHRLTGAWIEEIAQIRAPRAVNT